ncbi:MAG: DsbA family protein [Pseudomonadales bacterium]
MQATSFTLIYDTYCGWCYGAAPIFKALLDSGAQFNCYHLQLFHGANALPLDKASAARIASYDRRIAALTAQPFGEPYFKRVLGSEAQPIDSGLTARAAALSRDLGAAAELALAHRLQQERYVNGNAPDDIEVAIDALSTIGVCADRQQLHDQLTAAATFELAKQSAQNAQREMHSLGVSGVPCLIAHSGGYSKQVELTQYLGNPEKALALLN